MKKKSIIARSVAMKEELRLQRELIDGLHLRIRTLEVGQLQYHTLITEKLWPRTGPETG